MYNYNKFNKYMLLVIIYVKYFILILDHGNG